RPGGGRAATGLGGSPAVPGRAAAPGPAGAAPGPAGAAPGPAGATPGRPARAVPPRPPGWPARQPTPGPGPTRPQTGRSWVPCSALPRSAPSTTAALVVITPPFAGYDAGGGGQVAAVIGVRNVRGRAGKSAGHRRAVGSGRWQRPGSSSSFTTRRRCTSTCGSRPAPCCAHGRGPTLAPAVRRVAGPVEAPSLEAGEFGGVPPDARPGSGAGNIWEGGPPDNPRDEPGPLSFAAHGSKLTGGFALTRTGQRRWILVKVR